MDDIPGFLGPLISVRLTRGSPPALMKSPSALLAVPITIPIVVQSQLLRNWCWAAVTASVRDWYREFNAKPQCAVASEMLAMDCCPPGPDVPSNPRNREYNITTALGSNAALPVIAQSLMPDQIVQSINQQRPICCAIQWPNTRYHFVILAGYLPGTAEVIIRDPLFGQTQLLLNQFSTAYRGTGRWAASILTKKA